jgi:hypothetical protein
MVFTMDILEFFIMMDMDEEEKNDDFQRISELHTQHTKINQPTNIKRNYYEKQRKVPKNINSLMPHFFLQHQHQHHT